MDFSNTILGRRFWKKFANIFTSRSLSTQIQANFEEMLVDAEKMYVSLTSAIIDTNSDSLEHIRETFFTTDQRINALEQKIRREILVHISIAGDRSGQLTYFLLLLNLVKSAERVGDYIKNIFEIFEQNLDVIEGEYLERFKFVRAETMSFFTEVRTAVSTMDPKLAKAAIKHASPLIDECRSVRGEMMRTPEKAQNPVAVALLFRYQKRILSHLRKIARSQVTPFDAIGNKG